MVPDPHTEILNKEDNVIKNYEQTHKEETTVVKEDENINNRKGPISVLITLTDKNKTIVKTQAMLDSGADYDLINERLVEQTGLHCEQKDETARAFAVNGLELGPGITKTVTVHMKIGDHEEEITLYLADTGTDTILLGNRWKRIHDPDVQWHHNKMVWRSKGCVASCLKGNKKTEVHCLSQQDVDRLNTKTAPWASYSKDNNKNFKKIFTTKSKSAQIAAAAKVIDTRPLEERIPRNLHEYLVVFEKEEAEKLPKHRGELDLGIYLTPGAHLEKGPLYKLAAPETEVVKEQLAELLRKKYIKPSNSPCSSPILLVGKKDGKMRLCVDYRKLNNATIPDHFPIPNTEELLNELKAAKIFTKIDLRAGYNLVRIKQGHEWMTAMRTRFGVYEWLVMPFGLKNAPSQFQKMMTLIFEDAIGKWLIIYIDDILIYSRNQEEHDKHVKEVIRRLKENGLFANAEKCDFNKQKIEYLGHFVGNGQLEMDPEKVKAVMDWPAPKNVKEVQQLLGFANFYRRFIDGYSSIVKPLTRLTGKVDWKWDKEEEDTFIKFKEMFTTKPVLILPDMNKPFAIKCDASDFAIGAVLLQEAEDGFLHPIAYMSKALTGNELRWTVLEKELFALVTTLKSWRHYLQNNQEIKVFSDHLNLKHWVTMDVKHSQRLCRWAEALSYFNFKIGHISGVKNVEADGLSRRPDHLEVVTALKKGDSYEHVYPLKMEHFKCIARIKIKPDHKIIKMIATHTKEDDFAIKALLTKSPAFKKLKIDKNTEIVTCNGLIYVPKNREVKRLILQSRHDAPYAGHLGRRKTLEAVQRDFYWPGMMDYIIEYTKTCDVCQRNRLATRKQYGLLQPMPIPSGPWKEIGYDMIGPLPESEGYNAIMTIVDRLTKQAHFIPCRTTLDSPGVAKLFLENVWKLHGTPTRVISDRGPVFNSKFMQDLYKALGVKDTYTTAYHPQTDGQSERTNQIAKSILRKMVNEEQTNWASLLPLVEFAYNNAEQESIHMSPFMANYGYNPNIQPKENHIHKVPSAEKRIKNIKRGLELAKKAMKEAQQRQKEYYDRRKQEAPTFQPGDLVLVDQRNLKTTRDTKKLDHKKVGPFKVLKRIGVNAYKLKFSHRLKGLSPVINVNLLEAYHPDTIEGRTKPPPPPVEVSPENVEFEVKKIIKHKPFGKKKTLKYLVKWKGLGSAEEEWLSLSDLKNSPEVLEKYWEKHPELKPKEKKKKATRGSQEKGISFEEGDSVRVGNPDITKQYKKVYEGPDLIRPNANTLHTMATRSTKRNT